MFSMIFNNISNSTHTINTHMHACMHKQPKDH